MSLVAPLSLGLKASACLTNEELGLGTEKGLARVIVREMRVETVNQIVHLDQS